MPPLITTPIIETTTSKTSEQPASSHPSSPPPIAHDFHEHPPLAYATLLVWPFMLTLPLALTTLTSSSLHYTSLFPRHWYSLHPQDDNGTEDVTGHRHPLGLILGISA
eukprot:scaffold18378_cov23-Cyclotella_meneghiniana.AAC.1